ncbi:hypothetical protein ACFSHT_24080 [Paraburkholderia silviterrae]|uniref:Uncharacterized protein n=1 Tax=Paraburkholderia silviterrae TaxID=2528715 RepID=A0A4R5MB73_9BURK|nr:hypothetical protein [Paraburkholderia silviterrae]TDG24038.1 hypothetical protein EYW47_11030 [Paraburkholderia silviterrae]
MSDLFMLVDSDGDVISRGLTYGGAQALRDEWLAKYAGSGGGVTLLIKPNEPITDVPPVRVHFQTFPTHVENRAIGLPVIADGAERDHLRECFARRSEARDVLDLAADAAKRGKAHYSDCLAEVVRLRAADEAEVAAAGATLATRFKAGASASLEPNLRTGRHALLDAEARCDAARKAAALLNSEVSAAEDALATAEQAVERSVDALIHADLQYMLAELKQLWQKIVPLKLTIDGARYVGFPPGVDALAVLQPPELPPNAGARYVGQLANYRKALLQNADAAFADQPEKVIA